MMGHDHDTASFDDASEQCTTIELARMACSPDPLQREAAWQQISQGREFGQTVFDFLSALHYRDGLDSDMANDLLQDTLITAYRKLVIESSPKARAWLLDPTQEADEHRLVRWLMTIAHFLYKNSRRKYKRARSQSAPWGREAYNISDGKSGPEMVLVRREEHEAVAELIHLLEEQLTAPHWQRLEQMLEMLASSTSGEDLNITELAKKYAQSRTLYYRTLRQSKDVVSNQPDSYPGGENNG